jgi:hypothetical protein
MLTRIMCALSAIAAIAVVSASCLSPTETTLVVSTDVDCGDGPVTDIFTGRVGGIDPSIPNTQTSSCNPRSEEVGTLVVVPSSDDETFEVEVVTAIKGKDPAACAADITNCIVSRRIIRSLPHTPLWLPIDNLLDCLGVLCASDDLTCSHGRCVPDTVNSAACTTKAGCPLTTDGGFTPDGTAGDASSSETGATDASGDREITGEDAAGDAATQGDTGGAAEGGADSSTPLDSGADAPPPADGGGGDGGGPGSDGGVDGGGGVTCAGFSGPVACPDNGPGNQCLTPVEGCCGVQGPDGACTTSSADCLGGTFMCCTGKAACGGQYCCNDTGLGTQSCVLDAAACGGGELLCNTSNDCPPTQTCVPASPTSPISICADVDGGAQDGGCCAPTDGGACVPMPDGCVP